MHSVRLIAVFLTLVLTVLASAQAAVIVQKKVAIVSGANKVCMHLLPIPLAGAVLMPWIHNRVLASKSARSSGLQESK